MRVNTAQSIETANTVHLRYGSWQAAREAARFEEGKFVLHVAADSTAVQPSEPKDAAPAA